MDRTFIPTGTPSIARMHWLAMKKIFDPGFSPYEEAELERGIDVWSHLDKLHPEETAELKRILKALEAAEARHPTFEVAKFYIKKFGFKYWNYFRAGLPYIGTEPYYGESTDLTRSPDGRICLN